VLLGAAMLGAVAAGRHSVQSAMSAMSRLAQQSLPAEGEIAAFHRRKRRAFETIQQTEQGVRAMMEPFGH
jgi:D-ribulokinase